MDFYFAVFLFAWSATITPGPNNIMIMSSGVNYGVKQSIPHLLGICFGFPAMVIIIGSGFGAVFETYPMTHEIIKIFGVLYLLYLAWLIAQSSPTPIEGKHSKPLTFLQAALFQWVNPKGWVMATSAISAFTYLSPDGTNSFFTQVGFIALIFFVVAFPCCAIWLIFGSGLSKYLTSRRHQRIFNLSMALLLIASVLPVISQLIREHFF